MRKLFILKSLIDFIWFVTCLPLIPLALFFSVYMFFNTDALKIFNVLEGGVIITPWYLKIVTLLIVLLLFIIIYCVYVFRKTLRYFQRVKPFDNFVISSYKKIGYLLIVVGVISSVFSFVFHFLVRKQLQLQFGLSSYLLIICIGLFFLVLSELFLISKTAKEENQLTI